MLLSPTHTRLARIVLLLAAALSPIPALAQVRAKPLLMAHYMPWFQSKAVSGSWGWHWTMNFADPDVKPSQAHARSSPSRPQVASHYRPLMGLYDSGDQQALDCHVLLMKFAGIDGVLVDWYGDIDHYDYATNDRNTQRMFETAKRAGLKFALVYEDGTVAELIKAHKFEAADAVAQGRRLLSSVQAKWFRSPNYLTINGRPLFLVFGPRFYYRPADWEAIFSGLSPQPAFYTVHKLFAPAIGAFDWPLPQGGTAGASAARRLFYQHAKAWGAFIPAAYPRFHDFYHEAGVQPSYGQVDDFDGKTYEKTLTEALRSEAPIIQLVTWNDWGEGTSIEPSVEFGYRDLEITQRLLTKLGSHRYDASALRLPVRLYTLQKQYAKNPLKLRKLAAISDLLFGNRVSEAKHLLDRFN